MAQKTEASVSDANEIERIEKRVTRQEDLYAQRDQTVTQLCTEFKALAHSVDKMTNRIDAMPAAFHAICEQRLSLHKAQNCDQNHPKKDEPPNINENLVRILCAAIGIIAALLGVKVGL